MTTDQLDLPAVRMVGLDPIPGRLLMVTDPDLGDVPVRWRIPDHPDAWRWRCTACHTRSSTADCRHTFAAAMYLATTLLGLTAAGVAPTTPTEGATTP